MARLRTLAVIRSWVRREIVVGTPLDMEAARVEYVARLWGAGG
ncbi:MAG: hypothetical protein ABI725_06575 [Chloroflexota bacterium]